jgi:hypothetical protein
MATKTQTAIRQREALGEIRDVLEKHDPEAGVRLRKAANSDTLPASVKQPDDFAAYLAECVASLARLVDRELTPRKRGRPRKTAQ